jgi:prepilin-type N-terminal cleavage/methylation domain-containing protein
MLQKIKKRKESGFTIIEVLIVLAIAAVILLVVFLAVPALQRNSRNTQYRNEASRLIDGYNEVSSNAGGSVLAASTASAPGTGSDAAQVLAASNTKTITTLTIATGATAGTAPAATDSALIRTGAKCQLSGGTYSTATGSTRQVAILFLVETASGTGTSLQCIEG